MRSDQDVQSVMTQVNVGEQACCPRHSMRTLKSLIVPLWMCIYMFVLLFAGVDPVGFVVNKNLVVLVKLVKCKLITTLL